MVNEFNWKKGDLEVRTTSSVNGEPYCELIKWNTDENGRRWCFALAYFHKNRARTSMAKEMKNAGII